MVVNRTSLFINCSTGLDYKTEKAKYKYGDMCAYLLYQLNVRQAITIL